MSKWPYHTIIEEWFDSIYFYVSGQDGTYGFCRVYVPVDLLNATYRVFVNGAEVPCNLLPCSDSAHSYLHFDYELSTKDTLKDRADINKDGIVNMLDCAILSHAYLSRPGDPYWKPEADLNNDGVIDGLDMALLESVFYERSDIAEYRVTIIAEFSSFHILPLFFNGTSSCSHSLQRKAFLIFAQAWKKGEMRETVEMSPLW